MKTVCTHRGAFAGCTPPSKEDTLWRVELWSPVEDSAATDTPEAIIFPHDTPLTVEWEEWRPETAVQGSMATLRVIGRYDRES